MLPICLAYLSSLDLLGSYGCLQEGSLSLPVLKMYFIHNL